MSRSRLKPLLALPLAAAGAYYFPFATSPSPASDFHPSLHTGRFTPWTVTSHQPLSATSAIVVLRPPITPDTPRSYKGTWSVEAKNPSLSVGRNYTPFPPLPGPDVKAGDMAFFLRGIGETSRLLLRTPLGATVGLRGPSEELSLPADGVVSRVLFLAGGTGVAPAIQLGHSLLEQERVGRMTLLWAQRGDAGGARTDEGLQPGGWLTWRRQEDGESDGIVRYLVDLKDKFAARGGRWENAYVKAGDLTRGYVAQVVKRIEDDKAEDGMKLFVVSGPEGFVNHLAGPKIWADGQERQGPLGGLLGQMKKEGKLEGWKVWKL